MVFAFHERSLFSPTSTSGSSWSCAPVQRLKRSHHHLEVGAQLAGGRFQSRLEFFDTRTSTQQTASSTKDAQPYTAWEYTPEGNTEYWDRRPVKVLNRAYSIGRAFSTWLISSKLFGEGGLWKVKGKQAERLREILTDLGPAFVKIGQAFSSRPDVVPPNFLRELEKLQDKIPPFSDEAAMRIVHEDLGRPVTAIFSEISDTAVNAASLGQVYKARLKSDGRLVAVKVQRPNVRESIALDVHIMRFFAGVLGAFRKLNSDLPSLLDEWATSLFRELDYRQEAENGTRFKELYSHLEGVYVPEMIHELTSSRVLTMEWLDGVRLRSAGQGFSEGQALRADEMKLVEFGVQCSLEQMLEEGFYHADPHPGNLLRLSNGRLGYLDFGMMASIGPSIRRSLITATLHMVNREFGALAADFESLGLLPAGSQKDKVVPALARVFEKALSKGVSNVSFGNLSGDLGQTMYEFNFRIPAYYTLLVRSLSVLEGIALSSDPNYKVLGAAYPWIARRLLSDPSPELQETLRTLLYKNNTFQFNRLESLLQQALRSPARINRANGSVNRAEPTDRPLELLLGKDGTFVRGIVLDELAKGIDAAIRLSTDGLVVRARSRLASIFRNGITGPQTASNLASGSPLMTILQSLPSLADQSDAAQVAGISKLINVLQDVRMRNAQTEARLAGSDRPAAVSETVLILQWLVQEVQNLSPDARTEALRMPLSLGGKLSSRLLARAINAFASRETNSTTPVFLPRRARKASGTTPRAKKPSEPVIDVGQLPLTNLPRDRPASTDDPVRIDPTKVVAEDPPASSPADSLNRQKLVAKLIDVPSSNDLASINGIANTNSTARSNGIASINRIASTNGTTSSNGIASTNGTTSSNGIASKKGTASSNGVGTRNGATRVKSVASRNGTASTNGAAQDNEKAVQGKRFEHLYTPKGLSR